jgi:hypothetical protein
MFPELSRGRRDGRAHAGKAAVSPAPGLGDLGPVAVPPGRTPHRRQVRFPGSITRPIVSCPTATVSSSSLDMLPPEAHRSRRSGGRHRPSPSQLRSDHCCAHHGAAKGAPRSSPAPTRTAAGVDLPRRPPPTFRAAGAPTPPRGERIGEPKRCRRRADSASPASNGLHRSRAGLRRDRDPKYRGSPRVRSLPIFISRGIVPRRAACPTPDRAKLSFPVKRG